MSQSKAKCLLRALSLMALVGLPALLTACREPGADSRSTAPLSATSLQRVSVDAFATARENTNALVLDVRTSAEFTQAHIPGALNLDVNSDDFQHAIRHLDRDRPILVYCRSGRRSSRACAILNEAGFTHLLDLAPGLQGWQAEGLPVER